MLALPDWRQKTTFYHIKLHFTFTDIKVITANRIGTPTENLFNKKRDWVFHTLQPQSYNKIIRLPDAKEIFLFYISWVCHAMSYNIQLVDYLYNIRPFRNYCCR